MMRNLFRDEQLQAHFDTHGWVILPLFGEKEVKHLLEYYQTLHNTHIPDYGFHYSLDNEDEQFVRAVIQEIKKVAMDKIEQHFDYAKVFTASYVVKEPNPKSLVPPHQDWTFVDESQFYSLNLWSPLVDVDMDNGALGVISGSHRFFKGVRPSPSPHYKPPFANYMFNVFPYFDLKYLQAGQALVFNNSTMHASPPNTSPQVRIAAGIGITHAEAQVIHHYLLPGGNGKQQIETYEAGEDFFCRYSNARLGKLHSEGKKPEDVKSLGIAEFKVDTISADELVEAIKAAGNTMNIPLIEKLAKLFNYALDGKPLAPQAEVHPASSQSAMAPAATVTTTATSAARPSRRTFVDMIKGLFK